jgi:hypothetical protein
MILSLICTYVMQCHDPVIDLLILARCNVDLLDIEGHTRLFCKWLRSRGTPESSLLRKTKHKGVERVVSDIILQVKKQKVFRVPKSPGNPTKQQEDADRVMKELLEEEEEEEKATATSAVVSQKKKQTKTNKECRRKAADEQDASGKVEKQKDTEGRKAKAESEKKKTESVAAVTELKDKDEEEVVEEVERKL